MAGEGGVRPYWRFVQNVNISNGNLHLKLGPGSCVTCGGDAAASVLHILGRAEIAIALCVLFARRPARVFALTLVLMVAATAAVAVGSPRYLAAAFNPVSLNASIAILAMIGWLSSHNLPSARRCRYGCSSNQHGV